MLKIKKILLALEPQEWGFAASGIVAIILSVLGFFGYWQFTTEDLLKILLGATGFMALSFISTNHATRLVLNNLSSHSNRNYSIDFPDTLRPDLKNAETIDIYGIELTKSIDEYYSILEDRAKSGKPIRILLADPRGAVIEMVNKRYPSNNSACSHKIGDSIKLIRELQKLYIGIIEVKVIDYLFSRQAFMLNRNKSNGRVYISNYTFRLAGEKAKYLYKRGEGNYFEFYADEFNLMWNTASNVEGFD